MKFCTAIYEVTEADTAARKAKIIFSLFEHKKLCSTAYAISKGIYFYCSHYCARVSAQLQTQSTKCDSTQHFVRVIKSQQQSHVALSNYPKKTVGGWTFP